VAGRVMVERPIEVNHRSRLEATENLAFVPTTSTRAMRAPPPSIVAQKGALKWLSVHHVKSLKRKDGDALSGERRGWPRRGPIPAGPSPAARREGHRCWAAAVGRRRGPCGASGGDDVFPALPGVRVALRLFRELRGRWELQLHSARDVPRLHAHPARGLPPVGPASSSLPRSSLLPRGTFRVKIGVMADLSRRTQRGAGAPAETCRQRSRVSPRGCQSCEGNRPEMALPTPRDFFYGPADGPPLDAGNVELLFLTQLHRQRADLGQRLPIFLDHEVSTLERYLEAILPVDDERTLQNEAVSALRCGHARPAHSWH